MPLAVKRTPEIVQYFYWNGDNRLLEEAKEFIPEVRIYSNNDLENVELILKTDGATQIIIPPNSYIVKAEDGEIRVLTNADFYFLYKIISY
jgi:hypothetical protein